MFDTSPGDLLYNLFSCYLEDVVKTAGRFLNVKMRLGNIFLALLSSFVHEAFPYMLKSFSAPFLKTYLEVSFLNTYT